MNKKRKGKKKFTDIDEFNKKNDNSFSKKQNDDTFSKDNKDECTCKTKKKYDIKSCLDKLIFLFPNFTSDFIREFFEDNDKNYSRTKDLLKKLSEEDEENKKDEGNINNENVINNNNMIIEEEIKNEEIKNNNEKNNDIKKKNNNIDITHFAKFEVVDNKEFLESIEENKNKTNDNQNEKEKEKEEKNHNSENYDYLLNLKDKNKNEYNSIFNEDSNDNTNNCNINYPQKEEVTIDDYLFEQNIDFLCECFQFYTREEIIKKICDFNFDIDKVVLNLLDENNVHQQNEDEEDYANLEITDKDEILSNFVSFENGKQNDFDIELFQDNLVQKEIEEIIKRENNLKQKNLFDDDTDIIKDNSNNINNENDEFFLNKKINDIKTPQIKEDLKKLIKRFPLEEEYTIKLVYYQYMNYQLTYSHFCNKDDVKIVGLKQLLDSKDINNDAYSKNNCVKRYNNKSKKSINKYKNTEEQRHFEIFKKIIDKKPINWKLDEYKDFNLNDYMSVRKRLIIEARNAYNNKSFKNGQILMAKAKRYKQEIDKIYKNQKIQQFMQNNDSRYRRNNEIDLHGLNVQESKYIIDKKIKSLKEKKMENELKTISLTIITGTGSHSAGHQPVLYPNLLEWLKGREKLSAKGDLNKGLIYVTIY